jgi:hypothetical protein
MAQVSGVSKTCGHALETCGSNHIGRPAKPFLFLRSTAHREPRNTWQRQSSPEQGDKIWCHGTCGSVEALPSREAGIWSRRTHGSTRSPPEQGGKVRCRGTCGSAGAHLDKVARPEVTGYMVIRGCTPCFLS